MKLALLLFLLPMLASAQHERWSLMPGRDSLVAAPLKHLRLALSYRETVDSMNVNYRKETHERVDAAISWERALSKSDSIAAANAEKVDLCAVRLEKVSAIAASVPSLIVWARLGKWGTGTVCVAAVVAVAVVVKQAVE